MCLLMNFPMLVQYTDSSGAFAPFSEQFSIYLFERILLCCKEVNPNKTKEKLSASQKKDKKDKEKSGKKDKGKPTKLQLKGRIFMTNVSDVVSLVKPGKLR